MSAIEQLIPHRNPFLFVDELLEVSPEKIRGVRHFTAERDAFFQGHFPEYPIVPGVVLVEAMAQCGGAGLSKLGSFPAGSLFLLARIENAKFRRPVRPGDRVVFEINNEMVSPKMIKQSGKLTVENELAAEGSWVLFISGEQP